MVRRPGSPAREKPVQGLTVAAHGEGVSALLLRKTWLLHVLDSSQFY